MADTNKEEQYTQEDNIGSQMQEDCTSDKTADNLNNTELAVDNHNKRKEYLLTIALMSLSIAMTVVGAYISIPIGTIKITMQFFVTNTVCMLLGKKRGGLAVWIYILMGLIGLPIFSQFAGGLGYVLQPSFGFLIGFAVGGQIGAWIREKTGKDTFKSYFVSSLAGLAIVDIIGVIYGAVIMYGYLHSAMSAWKFLVAFLLPFIPIDIIKCILSSVLCTRLHKLVKVPRN